MHADACALLANPHMKLTPASAIPQPGHTAGSLPLLRVGEVHEACFGNSEKTGAGGVWYPPLTLFAALSGQFATEENRIAWIGRSCWPTFQLLCAALPAGGISLAAFLKRSLFLDPLTDGERFWAIGQALRCPGVKVVVADGSGMTATVSRRLQLAAEAGAAGAGNGVLGLLARPPWEMETASWAATRWRVTPRMQGLTGAKGGMGWEIELIGCRGRHPGPEIPKHWTMEWTYQVIHGTGTFHLSPSVGCGSAAAADAAARTESRTA